MQPTLVNEEHMKQNTKFPSNSNALIYVCNSTNPTVTLKLNVRLQVVGCRDQKGNSQYSHYPVHI